MMFTNYAYYKDRFFGTIVPELRFNYYASRASALIDKETFGRVKKIVEETPQPLELEPILRVPEEIQDCACCLAEVLFKQLEAPQISSHTAGGESISYVTDTSTPDVEIQAALRLYLSSDLLYRGI